MKHEITGSIYSTDDYDFFKSNPLNRSVKESKINSMISSFEKYGQQIPVLIDGEGNLVDGAHRVKICRRLLIPVKYIITENVDEDLIQAINDNQTSWSIQDHIEYHAKKGNKNYKQAIRLGVEYELRPGIIANSLGKKGLGTKDIKNGKLKLRDEDLLRKFLEYHKRFYFLPNRKQAYFVQSLFYVWSIPETDEERLFEKIVVNKELFQFSVPKSEFISRMVEEYNKHLKKEENMIA